MMCGGYICVVLCVCIAYLTRQSCICLHRPDTYIHTGTRACVWCARVCESIYAIVYVLVYVFCAYLILCIV